MNTDKPEAAGVPRLAATFSLAIALLAAAGLFLAWWNTHRLPFVVAAVGFLLVSPLWFLSPIDFRSLLGPLGSRATYRRRLTATQGLLALTGYTTLLAAIVLWLTQLSWS